MPDVNVIEPVVTIQEEGICRGDLVRQVFQAPRIFPTGDLRDSSFEDYGVRTISIPIVLSRCQKSSTPPARPKLGPAMYYL